MTTLDIEDEIRMKALVTLYKVASHLQYGISSSYAFNRLVEAIVMNKRAEYLTPRMSVIKIIAEESSTWNQLQVYIDKTGSAWQHFVPPTE
jgi:hypothetical protein